MKDQTVITVATRESDGKGGFNITNTEGGEYLLSAKNTALLDTLVVGRATIIETFKSTYGEFINSAKPFDGRPPVEKQVEHITAGVDKPKADKITENMFWKEAGKTLRSLSPELKQHPMYIELRNAYLHKMFDILGVEMKHEDKQ